MKTNASAQTILKIRSLVLCLALLGLAGGAFHLGRFLAHKVGPAAAPQTEAVQFPNANLADLFAAAH